MNISGFNILVDVCERYVFGMCSEKLCVCNYLWLVYFLIIVIDRFL